MEKRRCGWEPAGSRDRWGDRSLTRICLFNKQAEVARCKELETQVEKLEAQMDKTLGVMDELEREKEEAGIKAFTMEAQIKQAEKERDGLKAEAMDLAARVKEVESQLRAVLEQSALFPCVDAAVVVVYDSPPPTPFIALTSTHPPPLHRGPLFHS